MSTVLIRSKIHPDGRLYELRRIADLAAEEQAELVTLSRRSHASAARRGWPRRIAEYQVSRALCRAVEILLPEIEPRVLRALPDTARESILNTAAELS